MDVNLIVAVNDDGLIGNQGNLPWHYKEDLEFFKKTTLKSVVVMGRKTYESLPKDLPQRHMVIVSRNKIAVKYEDFEPTIYTKKYLESFYPGDSYMDKVISFCATLKIMHQKTAKKIFVIGGAEIYKAALETGRIEKMIISHIAGSHDGDTYFEIPESQSRFWGYKNFKNEENLIGVVYNKVGQHVLFE